jgi:hypothetical protein
MICDYFITNTGEIMNVEPIHNIDKTDATLKLLMYRSMLANDKAWLAGFEAAQCNQDVEDNPFSTHEEEFKAWANGWWEGFYNENYTVYELTKELSSISKSNKSSFESSFLFIEQKQERVNTVLKLDKNIKINYKNILFLIGIILFTSISMNLLLIE